MNSGVSNQSKRCGPGPTQRRMIRLSTENLSFVIKTSQTRITGLGFTGEAALSLLAGQSVMRQSGPRRQRARPGIFRFALCWKPCLVSTRARCGPTNTLQEGREPSFTRPRCRAHCLAPKSGEEEFDAGSESAKRFAQGMNGQTKTARGGFSLGRASYFYQGNPDGDNR